MEKVVKLGLLMAILTGFACCGMENKQELKQVSLESMGRDDLEKSLSNDKNFEKIVLEQLTEKSVAKLSEAALDLLVNYSDELKEKIKELFKNMDLGHNALEICLYGGSEGGVWLMRKRIFSQTKPPRVNQSMSASHLEMELYGQHQPKYVQVGNSNIWQFCSKPFDIRALYSRAVYRQHIEEEKGNFVAFHAQTSKRPLGLHLNLVFQELLGLYYNKPIKKEWWVLRFNKPGISLPYVDGQEVIKNGPKHSDRGDSISYKHFMNGPLFANTTYSIGSDTAGFFEGNLNVFVRAGIPKTIKELFAVFGWNQSYTKYEDMFNAIELAYSSKKNNGAILLLHIFSEDAWRNFVYYAASLGYRQSIKINGKATNDSVEIYKTIRNSPESIDIEQVDRHEIVFVQTEDHPTDKTKLGSLNPFNPGIKTLHYTVEDYSDIKKMIKDVFVLIKQDMQKDVEKAQNTTVRSKL